MFSNILVPCDTSYGSDDWLKPTISTALDIADKYDSHLHFLTVVPDNLMKGYYPDIYETTVVVDVQKRLKSIVTECVGDPDRVKVFVRKGGICSEIINAARELPADLIVMASHGPLLRDYLLGSNATHVALHVPCSVLILRPELAKQA
tara:strand:+ start:1021 stop:1464 length:444 start_codon:yes stop_codon:yes gene_type:complete